MQLVEWPSVLEYTCDHPETDTLLVAVSRIFAIENSFYLFCYEIHFQYCGFQEGLDCQILIDCLVTPLGLTVFYTGTL